MEGRVFSGIKVNYRTPPTAGSYEQRYDTTHENMSWLYTACFDAVAVRRCIDFDNTAYRFEDAILDYVPVRLVRKGTFTCLQRGTVIACYINVSFRK